MKRPLPKPGKQISEEKLPNRHALAELVGGDPARRSQQAYAKATPADANGLGQVGFNILRSSRGANE